MCYNACMISYETFSQYLLSGQIEKLHFLYESKEYIIAREDGEEGPVFAFASDAHEAVRYPSVQSLLKYAIIAGHSLHEVWWRIVPLCNDSLLDKDYVLVRYGEPLGRVTYSAAGTAAQNARYATQYLVPSIAVGIVLVLLILFGTLFVAEFTWTFFGVGTAIIAGAFIIAQLIFVKNTKRYRYGNPEAHLYLLEQGLVIITTRYEHAIPYTKIVRLDTEAGIMIVTMQHLFNFTADTGNDELKAMLSSIVSERKANKRHSKKQNKQANQSSSAS